MRWSDEGASVGASPGAHFEQRPPSADDADFRCAHQSRSPTPGSMHTCSSTLR